MLKRLAQKLLKASPLTFESAQDLVTSGDSTQEPQKKTDAGSEWTPSIARIRQSELFDAEFYGSQIAENIELTLEGLILHYLQNGATDLRDPHPLFDTAFYVSQHAEVDWSANNPLIHFLNQSDASFSSPHPLFCHQFYREKYLDVPSTGSSTFLHYVLAGFKEGRQPCIDFDPQIYAHSAGLESLSDASLYHFIKVGALQGFNPQFFFDERFAVKSSSSISNASHQHAKFMLKNEHGAREEFSEQLNTARLVYGSDLFDASFVASQFDRKLSVQRCVTAYLNQPLPRRVRPHLLFDVEYYESTNTDVDFSKIDPFVHFVNQGWVEGRNPHILFDTKYYLTKNEDVRKANINPLWHFVKSGKPHRLFSPYFHPQTYGKKFRLQRISNLFSSNKNPPRFLRLQYKSKGINRFELETRLQPDRNLLSHFLLKGFAGGVLPLANFDLLFDVRLKNIAAGESQTFIASVTECLNSLTSKSNPELVATFLQALTLKKGKRLISPTSRTMILASHEATRTGAPLLLLRLAKEFFQRGWDCLILLDRGGPIESEFSNFGHVLNFKGGNNRYDDWEAILPHLGEYIGFQLPTWCVLNSIETGHYAEATKKQGIKILNLVHEIADWFTSHYVQDIFRQMDLVVFPAEFVQRFAHKRTGNLKFKETVIHSALLDEQFADFDKSKARSKWREELGISNEGFVVLACGSPNQRKGVDIFFSVAQLVLMSTKRNVHFVWLGSRGRISPNTSEYFADWDVRQSNLASSVHFAEERDDIRTAFHGSDLFILTSRQDPFPCVAHNAMQASMPILCFADAGGTPEMIDGAGGKTIPYGSIKLFADGVIEYLNDEKKRHEHGALNQRIVVERFSFVDYFEKIILALS